MLTQLISSVHSESEVYMSLSCVPMRPQLEADGISMGKSLSKKNYISPYSQRYKK